MALNLIVILGLISVLVNVKLSHQTLTDAYNHCKHNTTRCFGLPHECETTEKCKVFLSVKPTSHGADFQLYWIYDPKNADRWAGAALSTDNAMGNDSVTECILWKNNTVTVRQGLTHSGFAPEDYGVKTVAPISGITNVKESFKDGIVSCSWSRAIDTKVTTLDFNIHDKQYFILMAYGAITGSMI